MKLQEGQARPIESHTWWLISDLGDFQGAAGVTGDKGGLGMLDFPTVEVDPTPTVATTAPPTISAAPPTLPPPLAAEAEGILELGVVRAPPTLTEFAPPLSL